MIWFQHINMKYIGVLDTQVSSRVSSLRFSAYSVGSSYPRNISTFFSFGSSHQPSTQRLSSGSVSSSVITFSSLVILRYWKDLLAFSRDQSFWDLRANISIQKRYIRYASILLRLRHSVSGAVCGDLQHILTVPSYSRLHLQLGVIHDHQHSLGGLRGRNK